MERNRVCRGRLRRLSSLARPPLLRLPRRSVTRLCLLSFHCPAPSWSCGPMPQVAPQSAMAGRE
eukprot:1141077-Pyramimonas_sp.AAC.2